MSEAEKNDPPRDQYDCDSTKVMKGLHTDGNCDSNSCKIGGGLDGVDVSVVNALSEWLRLSIRRDGKSHFMEFRHGVPVAPLKVTGKTERRGTEVHFLASAETFGVVEYHFDILARRLRELSFLNNGVKIQLIDQRFGKEENFAHTGGVKGFVEYINRSKNVLHGTPFYAIAQKEGITVEVAMQWNDSYQEQVLCFTNNIPQRDGGTHLTGLRAAMTRSLNQYIEANEVAKKAKVETTGDDMREGLSCVLSVKVPEPKFSSQTKDKLVSSEVGPVVQEIVTLIQTLGTGIGKDEYDISKLRYHRIIIMTDADVDGAHIRTLLLTFFYRQMPELVEHGHVYIAQPPLYKVKVGKEERYFKDDHERAQFMLSQALVGASLLPKKGGQPIEGKTLEDLAKTYLFGEAIVARASKIIDTEALAALMRGVKIDLSSPQSAGASALRLKQAMAANGNGVNVSARYDGKNERHQLVIERAHHGNVRTSVLDDDFLSSGDYQQLNRIAQLLQGLLRTCAVVERDDKEERVADFSQGMKWLLGGGERSAAIQRYKGLGEMNPEQLWETTMDPQSRRLLKVQIEDGIAAEEIFTKLMGDDVEPRRLFIEQNALVARLDV